MVLTNTLTSSIKYHFRISFNWHLFHCWRFAVMYHYILRTYIFKTIFKLICIFVTFIFISPSVKVYIQIRNLHVERNNHKLRNENKLTWNTNITCFGKISYTRVFKLTFPFTSNSLGQYGPGSFFWMEKNNSSPPFLCLESYGSNDV